MAKKVFVGMSGGVDSSVAAALLVQAGYEVTGVFMKNWTVSVGGVVCSWQSDYRDALAVAVQLKIPLKVYDFQTEYRQRVVDYMIAEYRAGRTPNPDITCNQEIKFKLFLDTALAEGADCIATGHYAKVAKSKKQKAKSELYTPKDATKDQTYFLYRVDQIALPKTLFPIGDYKKSEVRTLAKKLNLSTANKPDSQGICFIGEVGIKDFLQEYIPTQTGKIVDQSGKVIGEHDGAVFYTIGQRHGLRVGGGLPYYVVGKDMAKNQLLVTTNLDDQHLWQKNLNLNNTHWINNSPSKNEPYYFRTRHRGALVPGKIISLTKDTATIQLDEPQRAITPGQSVVIYDNDHVLGGGIIC